MALCSHIEQSSKHFFKILPIINALASDGLCYVQQLNLSGGPQLKFYAEGSYRGPSYLVVGKYQHDGIKIGYILQT